MPRIPPSPRRLPLALLGVGVYLALLLACPLPSAHAQTVEYYATGEEFVGPFPSWKNVKTDFGAKGDGVADDAPAIQKALDELKAVQTNAWSVLYFPAGTYRLGSTLRTERTEHNDYLGAQIIGEDPATTILLWDGPENGTMFAFDSWYSRVSRLTFDGRGRALDGLFHGRSYSTFDEWSELVFKDFRGCGLAFSWDSQANSTTFRGADAQHLLRCAFLRCRTGVTFVDWNDMDDNLWYCYFEDCGTALDNRMSGYHAIGNFFLRSQIADISGMSVPAYLAENVSIGSKTFLNSYGYGERLLQRNRIYDTVDARALSHTPGNPTAQSLVMLDNTLVSRAGNTGPAVRLESKNNLLVGNTYTVPQPLEADLARTVNLDQQHVAAASLPAPATVRLPGVNPRVDRPIFEVADGDQLQPQILAACAAAADGVIPVVHVPKGVFTVTTTVTIPAHRALQVIGDGCSENGTVIRWGGAGRGPLLKLEGPSRVTLRDLCLSSIGTAADVVLVDNCDQVGGRVYGDQLVARGSGNVNDPVDKAYFVDGVDHTDIALYNSEFVYQKNGGVYVKGGPIRSAGGAAEGQVAYLCGENGNDASNLYNVVDGGELIVIGQTSEVPKEATALDLRSSGKLTIAAYRFAITPSSVPLFSLAGFRGTATFLASAFYNGYSEHSDESIYFRLTGDGRDCRVLSAANSFGTASSITPERTWRDATDPPAAAVLLSCEGGAVNQPKTSIPNVVNQVPDAEPDPQFLRDCLAQLRALRLGPPDTRPAGVTDVKLLRVIMAGGADTTVLRFRGGQD